MPKFKKVIRKQLGGGIAPSSYPYTMGQMMDQMRAAGIVPKYGATGSTILDPSYFPGGTSADLGLPPRGMTRSQMAKDYPGLSESPEAKTRANSDKGKTPAAGPAKKKATSKLAPAASSSIGTEDEELQAMLKSTGASPQPAFDPSFPGLNQDAMINALMSGAMGKQKSDLSDLAAPKGRLASMEELGFKKSAAAPAGMSGMLASAEIPKTKAGMKKFMQDYGKFIALGAMAGAGGKGGQIAAPIIAALPGLIEMMKKRGKKAETKAHGGSMAKKSSGGDTPKKSEGGAIRKFSGGITKRMMPKLLEKLESMGDNSRAEMIRQYMPNLPQKKGSLKSTIPDIKVIGGDSEENQYSKGGAIRKFKGGSMNTKDSMLTPKYKKGGDMPKAKMGKAMGEMPQHKKMAMGKPTPQSTGQKFAKGGAAKYAGGGMCKGYGISKKIRPTGPMN